MKSISNESLIKHVLLYLDIENINMMSGTSPLNS